MLSTRSPRRRSPILRTLNSKDNLLAKNTNAICCGSTSHLRNECKFRNAVCEKCSKKGHTISACRTKSVHNVEEDQECTDSDNSVEDMYFLDVNKVDSDQISVPLLIDGKNVTMQLDTGCAVSIVPRSFYDQYCSNAKLLPTDVVLNTYSGEKLYPVGKVDIDVTYGDSVYNLPLIVTEEGTTPLFGRNWIKHVTLDWKTLFR